MKQFKLFAPIAVAVSIALFLFSCNSGGDKSAANTTTDTTAAATVKAPEPMPAANPGNVLIIQQKVANYAKWKPVYESHDSIRRAHGLTNFIIGRGMNDSKMDDVNKAKELTGSQEMKERMQNAGVIGKPTFNYLDVVMNDTSVIEQNARLMVTHKVKDWDAWKKEFDSHKQARMDAGLIDRGLGYSDGDNHLVSIVFAVTDMKKAKAFMNSKDLKDKMAKAGVEGPPTFFFYNIVQKY
jgi:hypothetical protein